MGNPRLLQCCIAFIRNCRKAHGLWKECMTSEYVELHARSAFSFLEGASVPEELIAAALELEMPAMALLDRDGVYGAPRFHLAAKKNGLKAHIGAEITLKVQSRGSNVPDQNADIECETLDFGQNWLPQDVIRVPVLVRNRTGYQNLCRLITLMKMRVPKHAKPGQCAVTTEELAAHAERLIDIFGKENVYAELQRHFNRSEEARNQIIVSIARELDLPLLATNGVCQASCGQREIADVFTCIRHHTRLETAGRLLVRNSERYLKSANTMVKLFADLPEAIANTIELSSRLAFTL